MFFQLLSLIVCFVSVIVGDTTQSIDDLDYFPLNYRRNQSNHIDTNGLDSSPSNHNFDAATSAIDDDNDDGVCGGTFRDRQVILNSPKYPRAYPRNSHCIYTFYSPFVCTSEFHIQFLDFTLETAPNCTKDRLTIGRDEILCGRVIGIMKYRASDGILRIVFSSDESIEEKGFKILITRLPCDGELPPTKRASSTTTTEKIVEITPPPQRGHPTSTENSLNGALHWDGIIPSEELELPSIHRKPFQPRTFQQSPQSIAPPLDGVLPPFFSTNPRDIPAQIPFAGLPFAGVARCCANAFNQKRFYLVSDGFPNGNPFSSDCVYHIRRNNPNICRLRIEFKYFLLGAPLPNDGPFGCVQNYLELDGRRICGCKSGMVYTSQWGADDRLLRLVNSANYPGVEGFVLDVIQEECPMRLTRQNDVFTSSGDTPNSKFFIGGNSVNRCLLDYGQWLRLTVDQSFQNRPMCMKRGA